MRRLVLAVWLLASTGCSSSAALPDATPTQAPRPSPSSGPTPNLPLAVPVASPSAAAPPAATGTLVGFGQPFALQSPAFQDGGNMPPDFTCEGANQSPPLSWSGGPPGTAAYALIAQDQDAQAVNGQPYTNWLLYNMPRNVMQLSASTPPKPLLANGAQQGINSNQSVGYLGPCPNPGDAPHHLVFEIFAQDGYVTLETGADFGVVHDALTGHTLAQTRLTAIVKR